MHLVGGLAHGSSPLVIGCGPACGRIIDYLFRSRCCTMVVFPEPKKPLSTTAGIAALVTVHAAERVRVSNLCVRFRHSTWSKTWRDIDCFLCDRLLALAVLCDVTHLHTFQRPTQNAHGMQNEDNNVHTTNGMRVCVVQVKYFIVHRCN